MYFVTLFVCPSPIRSRRIDVIFSPSLDAAQSLNNIKFLKQDEYFWLGNASDVYFSYEMLCMFARPAFHTLTSLRSWILDQVRYYSGTIVIFCSRHCHRTEKIGLMLQLPHVGCISRLKFKWFKCRGSGCTGMPGCPNDYKYFDGKVRIKATFVLLVISPPSSSGREREHCLSGLHSDV